MPLSYDRDVIKAVLKGLAETGHATPEDPLRADMEEHVKLLWADARPGEWDEIAGLLQRAFGMDRVVVQDGEAFNLRAVLGDGWFGRYLDYCSPGKSSPQFCFGSALTLIGAGFGRAPLIEWGVVKGGGIYPNIYSLLVGGSGSGKGAAFSYAGKVVHPAMAPNVLTREGSGQSYADQLAERYAAHGEGDGIIVVPELRVLLTKDSKYKGDIVTWLTDWFDEYHYWDRGLRTDHVILRDLCVSFLGASTRKWLRQMPDDAIGSGFLPRYFLFETTEAEEMRYWGSGMPTFDEGLREQLVADLERVGQNVPAEMAVQGAARKWLDDWYGGPHRAQYVATRNDEVKKWLNRKQAAIMKIATILQLLDGGSREVLDTEWLSRAKLIVDSMDAVVERVYATLGVTQEGEVTMAVLGIIRRSGGKTAGRAIKRALKNRYRAVKIDETLKGLKEMGELEMDVSPTEGTVWRLP